MNTKHILSLFLGYLPIPVMALTLTQVPLDVNQGGTPLIMLNMERDHKLYYEAYNDASDLDKDFALDIHYKPSIKYFGYFDSNKCYNYGSGKFTPVSITVNKQCPNTSAEWSGDFLNYLTTSRMDAMRRVLYGGKRSTDSATATVLERSYIPQDAHSWGKEYTSTAVNGYDISLYTNLSQPVSGRRHLFANTSLLCPSGNTDPGCTANAGLPLLRVLNDTNYRVWEWLSIERPVAGVKCLHGGTGPNCVPSTSGSFTAWEIVPAAYFSGLTQKTWSKIGSGTNCADHPNNAAEFATMETCAKGKSSFGSRSVTQINGSGNPNSSQQDDYFTLFEGNLIIPAGEGGNYKIGVDGDDAVEVSIDGNVVVGWYGGHGNCNSCLDSHSATINLSAGSHTIKFRHEERAGGDNYYLNWQRPVISSAAMTNYVVRVDACVTGLLEEECRGYPKDNPTVYKPGGILQQFGESDRMAFGLITGSYTKNVSGGVLRKNISSIKNEIDANTGQFTTTTGIIKSIDALKIVGFLGNGANSNDYYYYNQSCGVPEVGGPLAEGRCRMWGNPTAELMYEGLRYFAGKASPTSDYTYTSASSDDSSLGLPLPAWENPYRTTTGGYPACSKASQLVISDINPNFDTDQLPGRFGYTSPLPVAAAFSGDVSGLNVTTLANNIWDTEYGSSRNLFIGQSGANNDGAPTAKVATGFASIRGLSPEEPTQQGGYYSGSVALFGKTNDLNPAAGDQKTDTFSVALASPLPRIEFPLNGKTVTVVPFAKTVGGCGGVSAAQGSYQPTNTIVDFYVDTIVNTNLSNINSTVNSGRPYAKFRINYEDSEYGSDHDMDAIAEYELSVKANNTLDVRASSNYAAGGCIQHMGYVISGTTADGTYLEIRDPDTVTDVDYYLDTPNTTNFPLPTDTTRNFTAGTISAAAFVAHDPLWYAAKWGGFIDGNRNNRLDGVTEWDSRNGSDGVPDSYFLVSNASELKKQLDKTFTEILDRDLSNSAAATTSSTLDTKSRVYRARFNTLDWSGQLESFKFINSNLSQTAEWDAGRILNDQNPFTDRVIITKGAADGVPFRYDSLTGNATSPPATGTQQFMLNQNSAGVNDKCGLERVAYLRGDKTNEAAGGTFKCAAETTTAQINKFRQRKTSVLGDIVSSTPLFVGAPNAGFSDTEAPGYSAFSNANVSRTPVIYAGANDGMLHGFDASVNLSGGGAGVNTDTSGKEVLAYVPSAVFPNLSKLTDQGYNANHQFYVDDSPMSADVDIGTTNPDWRTVLVGSMGAGGKGYFALDVTNPSAFNEGNAASLLLWEFTEADMGFAFNRPAINFTNGQSKQFVKLKVGNATKWALIVGNGYNSPNGKAVLYVVFVKEGIDGTWSASDYKKIVADASSAVGYDNGLSSPLPLDSDGDGFIDTVYAGDLKGNMWRFLIGEVLNASGSPKNGVTGDPSTWKVAFSGDGCGDINPPTKTTSNCVPLFTARNTAGQIQPIFWPPELVFHPIQGQLVYFGTGKYIESSDSANTDTQTFYGIWDKDDGTTTVSSRAADLLQQQFSATTCADPDNVNPNNACTAITEAGTFRIPTAKQINWRTNPATASAANCTGSCTPTHMGWYIDMIAPKERVTGIPKVVNDILFFNTLIPPDTTCSEATGFLAALDFRTGGLLNSEIFNTNGNTRINSADFRVGALQVGAVIGGTTIVRAPGLGDGTSGETGSGTGALPGDDDGETGKAFGPTDSRDWKYKSSKGRLNWREILPN